MIIASADSSPKIQRHSKIEGRLSNVTSGFPQKPLFAKLSFMKTILSLLLFLPMLANAEVYKIEKDGKVTYTSKPPTKNAAPATLPKLGRWEVAQVKAKGVTCDSHGGVNCQLGADSDGSVICTDDFKDSTLRFSFTCSAAKLEIVEISKPTETGEFSVTVRNSKSVVASGASVLFKPEKFEDGSKLDGPELIDPFGVAEFHFKPQNSDKLFKPSIAQILVNCANCG